LDNNHRGAGAGGGRRRRGENEVGKKKLDDDDDDMKSHSQRTTLSSRLASRVGLEQIEQGSVQGINIYREIGEKK
jgi:hypothetical protein